MKSLFISFAAAISAFLLTACTGEPHKSTSIADIREINSPNMRLELSFSLSNSGEPQYSLKMDGKTILREGKMGFDIKHQGGVNDIQPFVKGWHVRKSNTSLHPSQLKKGFTIDSVVRRTVDDKWAPVWGEEKEIRNHYNELMVVLNQETDEKQSRSMIIRFRLFDDGLGFRYEFPKQDNLSYFIIEREVTEFIPAEDLTAFWIAGDYDSNEYLYTTSKISEIAELYPNFDREGNSCLFPMPVSGVQTPIMFKNDSSSLYMNIHEAALNNFPAMQLEVSTCSDRTTKFTAHLVPDALDNRGYVQTPQNTPWRTIVVADNAPAILESRLILNLNEPCAIKDTKWIRPQKFVGVWWQMFAPGQGSWSYSDEWNVKLGVTDFASMKPNGRHAANTDNVKKYIDFASKNGIHGVLVEGWDIGWEDWTGQFKENVFDFMTPYPDFDVVALREYAKKKGVQLIMHHETSGSISNYERYLDRAYQFMKDNNYSAVKSGYVGPIIPRGEHHYGQMAVNHYLHCIRRAADYEIMVDAHEPVRPTGMHRTYPNYLAAESARGTEFETFFEKGNSPEHTTILPFTRIMGGPMDYTPGIFEQKMSKYGDGKSKARVHTTLTKQLALYVTLYSPLQMVADLPQNYERFPDAFQFIREVPTDWDFTKVLEAEPGDFITTARKEKNADRWFIGAITDENARTATIDLSRIPLSAGKYYEATIFADGEDAHWDDNPQSYTIATQKIDSSTVLHIPLAPGGGCAIILKLL